MRTVRAGNTSEAAILRALNERGFHVSIPFGGAHPYDLLVEIAPAKFLRVQCKTAWPRRGCLLFNSHSTDHGSGPGSYAGRADLFGVFFPPLQSVYLVPVGDVPGSKGWLRLIPPRNNQRRRVRFAEDYAIERWADHDLVALVRNGQSATEPLDLSVTSE